MTVRLIVCCDGTRAERPTLALEACRVFLPTSAATADEARADALRAGWRTRWHPGTWPGPSVQQELCPTCVRAMEEIGD